MTTTNTYDDVVRRLKFLLDEFFEDVADSEQAIGGQHCAYRHQSGNVTRHHRLYCNQL